MSSFVADKIVMDGLTYDDVLLIPAYSEVLPKTVELKTKFSRHIELNVPFVTAAMDTVTESAMAIAIAREGGIGVIHKNMSIDEQARQVAIVKRAETILAALEKEAAQVGGAGKKDARKALPEIAARNDAQLSFFQLEDPVLEQVRDEIIGLDINNLTPLEALNKLNEIKKIVRG